MLKDVYRMVEATLHIISISSGLLLKIVFKGGMKG